MASVACGRCSSPLTHRNRRWQKIDFNQGRVTLSIQHPPDTVCRGVNSPYHCARQDQELFIPFSQASEAQRMLNCVCAGLYKYLITTAPDSIPLLHMLQWESSKSALQHICKQTHPLQTQLWYKPNTLCPARKSTNGVSGEGLRAAALQGKPCLTSTAPAQMDMPDPSHPEPA